MTIRLDARLAGDLWFFRVTVDAGSFVRAGERLAVTQSAVTQRIQRLEERLGCTLLMRTTRPFQLTSEGRELYEAALGLDALDEALQRIARGAQRRTLRVSCVPSLATEWLVPRLKRFSDENQDLDVAVFAEVHEIDRSQMQRENIDIVIRYGPSPYKGAGVILEHVESVYPVCSPTYRPRLESSDPKQTVVLLHDASPWASASDPTEEWSYWLTARGIPWEGRVQNSFFNLAQLAMRASMSGAGVALGRSLLISSYLKDGALTRCCDGSPLESFRYFVYTREPALDDDLATFVGWLSREMKSSSA